MTWSLPYHPTPRGPRTTTRLRHRRDDLGAVDAVADGPSSVMRPGLEAPAPPPILLDRRSSSRSPRSSPSSRGCSPRPTRSSASCPSPGLRRSPLRFDEAGLRHLRPRHLRYPRIRVSRILTTIGRADRRHRRRTRRLLAAVRRAALARHRRVLRDPAALAAIVFLNVEARAPSS